MFYEHGHSQVIERTRFTLSRHTRETYSQTHDTYTPDSLLILASPRALCPLPVSVSVSRSLSLSSSLCLHLQSYSLPLVASSSPFHSLVSLSLSLPPRPPSSHSRPNLAATSIDTLLAFGNRCSSLSRANSNTLYMITKVGSWLTKEAPTPDQNGG